MGIEGRFERDQKDFMKTEDCNRVIHELRCPSGNTCASSQKLMNRSYETISAGSRRDRRSSYRGPRAARFVALLTLSGMRGERRNSWGPCTLLSTSPCICFQGRCGHWFKRSGALNWEGATCGMSSYIGQVHETGQSGPSLSSETAAAMTGEARNRGCENDDDVKRPGPVFSCFCHFVSCCLLFKRPVKLASSR